jgi:hypothetical protein
MGRILKHRRQRMPDAENETPGVRRAFAGTGGRQWFEPAKKQMFGRRNTDAGPAADERSSRLALKNVVGREGFEPSTY